MDQPILLYDGVCGLCNRFVQFVLRRDHARVFRFAWLQGELGREVLQRQGINPQALNTVYVVVRSGSGDERLLVRSDAVRFVLRHCGWGWRAAGTLLGMVPQVLRDAGYDMVARNRYRIFGRSDLCRLPRDADHSRFLDGQE